MLRKQTVCPKLLANWSAVIQKALPTRSTSPFRPHGTLTYRKPHPITCDP
jgi:hypothetical protein